MTFYSQFNKSGAGGGFGQSWREEKQIAGYQQPSHQEFGQGKPSVKLHHNPGGASNFSLAQTGQRMAEDERFDRIKPGVS